MKKNDCFELEIKDVSDDGAGIGKRDGFVWFVKDTVPGDTAEVSVMKIKKSYGFARLQRITVPSPDRAEALCPIARSCGGCQLQAMSYEAQLRFKERKVLNNLRRIGDFAVSEAEPIIAMEEPYRYRNKAQFPIGRDRDGKLIAGFYAGHSHRIIACEDCLLGCEENRRILDCILRWMKSFRIEPYDEISHKGLVRHVLIRKGFASGQLMVCLVINARRLPYAEALTEALCGLRFGPEDGDSRKDTENAPYIASVSYSINCENTNVIMGTELMNLYGPGYIEDSLRRFSVSEETGAFAVTDAPAVKFRISPLSFYQVNPRQTEKLYSTALHYAGLTGNETVLDLYCGIGTISLFLAQNARKVYGVEIIPQAIENARENARLNGIENAEFFVGKAEEVLPEWYERQRAEGAGEKIDVVVVDPPRKGCDGRCLETIVKLAPKRVVYVSCDSATLARDLKYLCANGYALKRVRACDMFGQTVHVETVVLLSKAN